jgi:DNA repair protein RecO (recombination protein O)
MNSKTEAIVLHSLKYGESRLIVDMFTREHGRLSFVVTVPKTGRSRMRKQYFQPLTLLMIESDLRPQQQLHHLREASLLSPFVSLLSDAHKLAIALFIAEFLYHALRDEQRNVPLFDYVRSSIEWLDSRQDRYANFHLVFLMHLSRFLGFFPNLTPVHSSQSSPPSSLLSPLSSPLTLTPHPYFDLRSATFCTEPPLHQDYLLPVEASRIVTMMRMNYATMHLFRLSRTERNRTLDIIERYYRLHLPALPELRSLPVLRELF